MGLDNGFLQALATPLLGLIIVSSARLESGASWRVPRWLVTLGDWSFALYLTHALVLKAVQPFAAGWVAVAISVPVCLALSGIAYRFYERPVEKWLRARPIGGR